MSRNIWKILLIIIFSFTEQSCKSELKVNSSSVNKRAVSESNEIEEEAENNKVIPKDDVVENIDDRTR